MNNKDHLIDLLIHDLSGPISVVVTSAGNLLKKEDRYGPLTSRQRQSIERILRNASKAQSLLTELVEVYRSDEGLFDCRDFQVRDVLKESIVDALEVVEPLLAGELTFIKREDAFLRILEEHGIIVECTGRYHDSPFFHDKRKIQLILRNLISNALKYRREKINISVSGDLDLTLSVIDDGPGIPENGQEIVFKRFGYNKGNAGGGTGETPGLGFGLSCVKALVKVMGGVITLQSREGAGTHFTVCVPSHKSTGEKEAEE
ncbi:sensor histidine kinase [Syntrophorhabdus aromaticivorans]|jgi:signal transduction histidine kinase|uniref:histidine kinase n=1 Tax=Syntrophorhabdus aromaticivorans TaxID=328301 RepID=A0A971M5A3_9BACT|nr:HAMP domain-containing sensor histidine kinase [Syntrophorhabdus aromaticivorans]NLW36298.1 HAMP domain-containing histidine kinase [Syntrophorhabdus aromaticivorans]